MSWEAALLKRWPRLEAVVERTSVVSQGAKCPVHQVWISSKNALYTSNASKDNVLDGVSRLVFGTALSTKARDDEGMEEAYPHLKSNLEIKKRISLLRREKTIFDGAGLMTGLQYGSYPFLSRSGATRLTDNSSYAFDLYVLSSDFSDTIPRVYGSAEHVAALCWVSREALRSENFELNVACDQWIQVRYWLETVSAVRGARL